MSVIGERQVTGENGRNPSGQEGWRCFGYGSSVLNILGGLVSLGDQTDACPDRLPGPFRPGVRAHLLPGRAGRPDHHFPGRPGDGHAEAAHPQLWGQGQPSPKGDRGRHRPNDCATFKGVSRQENVREHPDIGHSIQGLVITHWETLLDIAARCLILPGRTTWGRTMSWTRTWGPYFWNSTLVPASLSRSPTPPVSSIGSNSWESPPRNCLPSKTASPSPAPTSALASDRVPKSRTGFAPTYRWTLDTP